MASVYGSLAGFTLGEISAFISAITIGALLWQFPVGWVSDRMDRRVLIIMISAIAGVAAISGYLSENRFSLILAAAFLVGGMANPLYALLIAYTNDFLEQDDMAAAAGGLVFINGLGAITGPLITGWLMGLVGPGGFFVFLAVLLLGLAGYGTYRMTQRAAPAVEDTGSYAPITPAASPVAVELAQEVFIDTAQETEESNKSAQ